MKAAEPQRVGENPIRKKFIGIRNIAECPKCTVKGKLRLTGGSSKPYWFPNEDAVDIAKRKGKRRAKYTI